MSNANDRTVRLRRRWRWLGALLAVVLIAGGGWGIYWAKALRHTQATDDAYVGGNVVQITPQISGTVIAIGADDTQFVKAGQPLVRLDQADARVALDQAEAQLARTVRDVRNLYATSAQLEAAVELRVTDLKAAQSDLARRERLGSSGAVSARNCNTPSMRSKRRRRHCSRHSSSSWRTARASTARPSRTTRRCAPPPPRCVTPT